MSFSKWKFSGSRKASPSSSSNMDTSLSSSPITGMSTPTSPISSSGGNSGSRSSKSSLSSSPFSWFRSSPHRSNKKRKSTISKDDPAFARLHKPFTPQNLEHQRMFESFEWNFGGSSSSGSSNDDDDSYRRRRSSSISPRETRDMTIDDYALQNQSLQGSLSSAFSCLSTRDAGRQGYDQTTAAHY